MLARPLATLDLQCDQFMQQGRPVRSPSVAEIVLDPRTLTRFPGGFETVAEFVHAPHLIGRQRSLAEMGTRTHGVISSCQVLRIKRSLRSMVRTTQPILLAISASV